MPPSSHSATEIIEFTVKNSHCGKPLEVHFDDQLQFDFNIEKLFKNANRKLMR